MDILFDLKKEYDNILVDENIIIDKLIIVIIIIFA